MPNPSPKTGPNPGPDPGLYHRRDHSAHPAALTPAYKSSVTRAPSQPLLSLVQTRSEITGPVFTPAELGPHDNDLILNYAHGAEPIGERITVHGRVTDGNDHPVPGALIEIWQADAQGRYNHPEGGAGIGGNGDPASRPNSPPAFRGWGRVIRDFEAGVFSFETIKPGPVPDLESGLDSNLGSGPNHRAQAPHLNLRLVARGINLGLSTRMYFAGEAAANATDPVLTRIDTPSRRQTLIARHDPALGSGTPVYCFDIHLQGASETVFFDI